MSVFTIETTIQEDIENAVAARRAATGDADAIALRHRLEGFLEEGILFWCYGTLCYSDSYTNGITCAITGIPIE